MLPHIIDFLVDYFTNINAKKIFGGILVLLGLVIIGQMGISGNPDTAVLYAIIGIFIAGIGFVVIYYDMAKDKLGGGHDELRTLSEGYKQKELEERKVSGWHMSDNPDKKVTPDKN